MAQDQLSIVLEAVHPVTTRAAYELSRAWREVGGSVRLGAGRGACVHIGLGSLVRPSAVVRFEAPYADAAAADQLALTIAAWDSLDEREGWRALSAPLPSVPHYGQPSPHRPWAVSLRPRRGDEGERQLHVFGGVPVPRRADVWWPRLSAVVAAVLGRADCVLGERDPLVYDAFRAGIEVRGEAGEIDRLELDGALAGLVPPTLNADRRLWRHVAETAHEIHTRGTNPAPLMTPAWVALGRDRMREHLAAPPSPFERLRRRHDKLRRDPKRFFADSKHAPLRALGAALFRR